jgi:DNA-binding transcriptional regulator YhcF (GntR family)
LFGIILPYAPILAPKNANETLETEKAPVLVVKRIREAILDEVFKPGDHLGEVELAEKFEVSRSPVREALLALEKEGTLIISPYKGPIVKPLSVEEVLDIAELRLALISLALKLAHRHLSPADFDHAYDLAKRLNAYQTTPKSTLKITAILGHDFYQSPTTDFARSVPTTRGPRHSVRATFDEAFSARNQTPPARGTHRNLFEKERLPRRFEP